MIRILLKPVKPKTSTILNAARESERRGGFELKGATAIVTGAGTGIGRELALSLAREGANVVCAGRRRALVGETARLINSSGGRALSLSVDVTNSTQIKNLVVRTLGQFRRIDLLFNNAGSFRAIGPAWQVDPDVWWHDVTTNLLGPVLCSRAVLPHKNRDSLFLLLCRTATLIVFGCAFVASISPVVLAADVATKSFNVPAGEAEATLREFSKQAGVQLIYDVDNVSGVRTAALQGNYVPRDALDRMLAGTRMVVARDEKTGALTVRRESANPNPSRAAPIESNRNAGMKDEVITLPPFEVVANTRPALSRSPGRGVGQRQAHSRLRALAHSPVPYTAGRPSSGGIRSFDGTPSCFSSNLNDARIRR